MAREMQCCVYLGDLGSHQLWKTIPPECRDIVSGLCMPQAKKRVWPAKAELIVIVCPFGFLRPLFYSWFKTMVCGEQINLPHLSNREGDAP
jgi:hypothetical protein